jgi:hypothetical protein
MRLPQIQYGGEVQSMGRYQSRAGELIVQGTRQQAAGMRRAGQMVFEAERSASQIIADAERNAAKFTADQKLANEKRKNDKIAQYKIQGAKLDIESKLAGDILKIRTDVGKYELDRRYQLGLETLEIEAGLAHSKLAIQSQLARDKLDIQNQLKLDILDVQEDTAWNQFLIKAATGIAQTAVSTYFERQNTKMELKVDELGNDYESRMSDLEIELTNSRTIDISDENIVTPEIRAQLELDLKARGVEVRQEVKADGTTGFFVETHEVANQLYEATAQDMRATLETQVDSTEHQQALMKRLDKIDGQLQVAIKNQSAKFENDWNKGWAEENIAVAIDNAKKTGNNEEVIKQFAKYENMGIYSPEEAGKKLEVANNEIWTHHFKTRMEDATSKQALELIKQNYGAPEKGLSDASRTSLDSVFNRREGELITAEANDAFDSLFPQYMGQVRSLENIGGRPQHEVKADFLQAIESKVDPSEMSRLGTKFDTQVNGYQGSINEAVNAKATEVSNLQEAGRYVPKELYSDLPAGVQAKLDNNTVKLAKGHGIDTDYVKFDQLRTMANPAHPDHAKFMAMDFQNPIKSDGTENNNWWSFNSSHRDALVKMQQDARSGKLGPEYMQLETNTNAFKVAWEAYHGKPKNQGQLKEQMWAVSVVNERLQAWTDANGGKEPDQNTRDMIIESTLTATAPSIKSQGDLSGKRKGWRMSSPVGLVDSPLDESVRWLAPAVRSKGVDPTYPAMNQLYVFLVKGARAEGMEPTDANLRYMYNKLRKSGINWTGY